MSDADLAFVWCGYAASFGIGLVVGWALATARHARALSRIAARRHWSGPAGRPLQREVERDPTGLDLDLPAALIHVEPGTGRVSIEPVALADGLRVLNSRRA